MLARQAGEGWCWAGRKEGQGSAPDPLGAAPPDLPSFGIEFTRGDVGILVGGDASGSVWPSAGQVVASAC